jgi:hypothetical protein
MDPVTAGLISFVIGIGVLAILAVVLLGVAKNAKEEKPWAALGLVFGSFFAAIAASVFAYSILTQTLLYQPVASLFNYLLTAGGNIEQIDIPSQ